MNFQCADAAKCSKDPTLKYNFYLNDYFLNNDNEVFYQRQEYESNKIGVGLIYFARPIQMKTAENIFTRDPTYTRDLFFQNELDYELDVTSKGMTF